MNLFIRSLSLTHTRLVHFSQIALVYSRRSERTGRSSILQPLCEIFKFFLGVLLQDSASKVSFWTLLAFTLFQSPHICFFQWVPSFAVSLQIVVFGVNCVYTFVVVASCASPVSSNMRACEFVLVLRCCSVNFTFTPSAQLSQLFDRFCSKCLMVFVEHLVLYTIRNPMECVFTHCVVFTPSTKLHVLFLRAVKVSNSHHLYCVEDQDYLKEFAISKILDSTWTEHASHPPHNPPPPTMAPVNANLPRHPPWEELIICLWGQEQVHSSIAIQTKSWDWKSLFCFGKEGHTKRTCAAMSTDWRDKNVCNLFPFWEGWVTM